MSCGVRKVVEEALGIVISSRMKKPRNADVADINKNAEQ